MYKTRAAVLMEAPGDLEVVDVDLDAPRRGELTVKMHASGLCHSDDHILTGDIPVGIYPFAMGHEGAGEVIEVGPETDGYEVGDHVVFSFLPACGRCRWCAQGMQNLCDLGAFLLTGSRFDAEESHRMHLADGTPVGQFCSISTLSEITTVDVRSAVKISKDLPLNRMCLLGCGVGTGWGSAVNSAAVQPGQTVIVMGVGGVGANALQGARHAGASNIIAVDPVERKHEWARKLGATHTFDNIEEAAEFGRSLTNGQGADSTIITVGRIEGVDVTNAMVATRKGGTVVVTAAGSVEPAMVEINLVEMSMYQRRIQGSLYGANSPNWTIPRLAQMYSDGTLDLDTLVTSTYKLEEVNQGYADMKAGKNLRGVVEFV